MGGWQTNPIPQELHDLWKKENMFEDGMALVTGELFRGKYKGMWLNVIDCDNKLAIELLFVDGLERLAKKTIVEQHANKDKAHIYLLTEEPMEIVSPTFPKDLRDNNVTPSIEVKAQGKQIIYCANSPHKDGSRLEIINCLEIKKVDCNTVNEKIQNVLSRYDRYKSKGNDSDGITNNSNFDAFTISFAEMTKDEFFVRGIPQIISLFNLLFLQSIGTYQD